MTTAGGELDCVTEQVHEHLLKPLLVDDNLHAGQGIGIFDLNLLLRRHPPDKQQARMAEFVDRHRRQVQLELAGFDPGEVEQVIDECQQVPPALIDEPYRFMLALVERAA